MAYVPMTDFRKKQSKEMKEALLSQPKQSQEEAYAQCRRMKQEMLLTRKSLIPESMNNFEALCRLASEENWCWNLFCTTCGHMHFRYAFQELVAGKPPEKKEWLVHRRKTRYTKQLGPLPKNYTELQKKMFLHICLDADIFSIAQNCTFPDWLGYLGLALEHMNLNSYVYKAVSSNWASQLKNLVPPDSRAHARLSEIVADESDLLTLADLETCERDIQPTVISGENREDEIKLPIEKHGDSTTKEEVWSYKWDEIDENIVKLVNGILIKAAKVGASLIHLLPSEKGVIVKFMVDGKLKKAMKFPLKIWKAVSLRFKIISLGQNGFPWTYPYPMADEIKIKVGRDGKEFDFSISTYPCIYGESIVITLLGKEEKGV